MPSVSIRGHPRQLVHLFAVDKEPWHVIIDQPDERCEWLHLERSPEDDEQIALPKVTLSELEEALWQLLAEEDDVGLDEPTMALSHREPSLRTVLAMRDRRTHLLYWHSRPRRDARAPVEVAMGGDGHVRWQTSEILERVNVLRETPHASVRCEMELGHPWPSVAVNGQLEAIIN